MVGLHPGFLVLDAAKLLDIIQRPGFELFLKYIRRFGVWASFKINFVKAMKSGQLAEIFDAWEEDVPPPAPEGEASRRRACRRRRTRKRGLWTARASHLRSR